MTGLWSLVEWGAEQFRDREMLVDEGGRRVSFGQFRDWAERVSGALAARAVRKGVPVTWQLPTSAEALVLTAALARLGAVQNPVIASHGAQHLEFVARQTAARLLVVAASWHGHDLATQARAIADRVGCDLLVIDPALPEESAPAAAPSDGDAVRWVFYTSGTTADPKGARHSDASVLASARAMGDRLRCTAADRVGMVFPVAHIGGCGTWLGASLRYGCTLILDSVFDAERTTELQRRESVTLAGSGTVFTQLYLAAQRRRPTEPLFPQVRAFTCGAAGRPTTLHAEVKKELGGVGVLSGYGMTEAPILTMASPDDPDDMRASTEGRASDGVEIRVVAEDGTVLGPGEVGELRVTGPQVMKGYVDPSLDDEAFDADGCLRTGDLGRIDAAGYVTITGRLKDVVIRKGETISARAIELELLRHPAVEDVAVIALPHPELGELACAVVVPTPGAAAPTLAELVAHLRDRGLAPQQWPERLTIVATLPRTSTGKVRKEELRELERQPMSSD